MVPIGPQGQGGGPDWGQGGGRGGNEGATKQGGGWRWW